MTRLWDVSPWDPPVSPLPLVLQTGVCTPMFYVGAEHSGPQSCIASTLPTVPSPQSSLNRWTHHRSLRWRATGPVHLLFPLARMFFPSLHSLPSRLLHQFLRQAPSHTAVFVCTRATAVDEQKSQTQATVMKSNPLLAPPWPLLCSPIPTPHLIF